MGTVRTPQSWREKEAAWRQGNARRGPTWESRRNGKWLTPAPNRTSSIADELEEFDWDSLRLAWDSKDQDSDSQESHEARAERSLALVDAALAAHRRRKLWLRLGAVVVTPMILAFAYRSARNAFS